MKNAYHIGMDFYGSGILILTLIVFSIVMFLILKNNSSLSKFKIRLLDILKGKYASDIITMDEFLERKSIIEEIEYSSQYTPILLERYANCIISTQELFKIINEIETRKLDDFITEKLVKGELSYEEFKGKSNNYS